MRERDALRARLKQAEAVVEAARKAHARAGHNTESWVECVANPPESCWWVQLDTALAALSEAPPVAAGSEQ
jgi:hypothetical protein